MRTGIYVLWLISLLGLFSCGNDVDKIPDISDIKVDVQIRRLEREIFSLNGKEDIRKYLNNNPVLARDLFLTNRFPPEQIVHQLDAFLNYTYNDTLYQEVQMAFPNTKRLESEIAELYKYIKYYFPDFKELPVYTVVSGFGNFGFGNDIHISPSGIYIGLDYFAGNETSYRPEVPGYILKRYHPEYITPTIAQHLSSSFIKQGEGQTMLDEMILYGKAHYFTDKVLPTVNDSLKWGYSGQELAGCYHNEGKIYAHFVDQNLLFESNHFKKRKYIAERPHVNEIDKECPGRIGQWLGMRIVESYAQKHSNESLAQVLVEEDAQSFFQRSYYRPEKKKK
ncbi:gliding motility lipoprotein GldB [Sediminitomix flava]|uniref:Gliding motility-associated lipoprotein GldB n=1 Tax=Sediminitomix flava TaxID=379075 RepID=A0A315Z8K8_SEDFL|nr:gliding motility lipoprotein GldB [Sediminitomix flava]PWJ40895.1 hypothetical protein BC781_104155 [Sediminitomix flava]